MEEKKYMFQYAHQGFGTKIIEDTGLITLQEANDLWNKHYSDCLERLKNDDRPQMCIWQNCSSTTDYHDVLKEIDYRDDLEIKNGKIYKKELTEL